MTGRPGRRSALVRARTRQVYRSFCPRRHQPRCPSGGDPVLGPLISNERSVGLPGAGLGRAGEGPTQSIGRRLRVFLVGDVRSPGRRVAFGGARAGVKCEPALPGLPSIGELCLTNRTIFALENRRASGVGGPALEKTQAAWAALNPWDLLTVVERVAPRPSPGPRECKPHALRRKLARSCQFRNAVWFGQLAQKRQIRRTRGPTGSDTATLLGCGPGCQAILSRRARRPRARSRCRSRGRRREGASR